MIIRYRPKYEITSLRDALMGLIPIPTLRKSEIFLYGGFCETLLGLGKASKLSLRSTFRNVIEIKPLRGFFGAMRIVIFVYSEVLKIVCTLYLPDRGNCVWMKLSRRCLVLQLLSHQEVSFSHTPCNEYLETTSPPLFYPSDHPHAPHKHLGRQGHSTQ